MQPESSGEDSAGAVSSSVESVPWENNLSTEHSKETDSSSALPLGSVSEGPQSTSSPTPLPTSVVEGAALAPSPFLVTASTSHRHFFDCQEELGEEQRHEQELQSAARAALEAARAADEEAQIVRQQEQQNQQKGSLVALSILLRAAAVRVWGVRSQETRATAPRQHGAPSLQDERDNALDETKSCKDVLDVSSRQLFSKEGRRLASRERVASGNSEDEKDREFSSDKPEARAARCASAAGRRTADDRGNEERREERILRNVEERFGMTGALREVRIQVVHGGCRTRVRVGLRDMALMHECGEESTQRLVYRHLTLEQPLLRVCFLRLLPPPSTGLDANGCPAYNGAEMPILADGQNPVRKLQDQAQRPASSASVSANCQSLPHLPSPLPTDKRQLGQATSAEAFPVESKRPQDPGCLQKHATVSSPLVGSAQGSSELHLTLQHFVCVYALDAVQDAALLAKEVQQGLKSAGPPVFSGFSVSERFRDYQPDSPADAKGHGEVQKEEGKVQAPEKKTDSGTLKQEEEENQAKAFISSPPNTEMRGDTSGQLDLGPPSSSHQEPASRKPGDITVTGRQGTTARRLLLRSRERLKALTLSTKYFVHVCAPTIVLPTKKGSVASGAVLVLHLGDIHVSSFHDLRQGKKPSLPFKVNFTPSACLLHVLLVLWIASTTFPSGVAVSGQNTPCQLSFPLHELCIRACSRVSYSTCRYSNEFTPSNFL